MKKFVFISLLLSIYILHTTAQIVECDTMTLTHVNAGIRFQSAMFTTPDSSIAIPMVNNTATNFAYPQIKLINTTPLPPGMSLYTTGWNVFASAWNIGDTAIAYTDYYVNTTIPDNYTVTFRLYATNFAPLSIDSCVFVNTFDINLKPVSPAGVSAQAVLPAIALYPNPAHDYLDICSTQATGEVDIYTLAGSLVRSAALTGKTIRLDITELSAGIYLLRDKRSGTISRFVKI